MGKYSLSCSELYLSPPFDSGFLLRPMEIHLVRRIAAMNFFSFVFRLASLIESTCILIFPDRLSGAFSVLRVFLSRKEHRLPPPQNLMFLSECAPSHVIRPDGFPPAQMISAFPRSYPSFILPSRSRRSEASFWGLTKLKILPPYKGEEDKKIRLF